MTDLLGIAALVMAGVALAFLMESGVRLYRDEVRRDASIMAGAQSLLRTHGVLVERVMASNECPEVVKSFVLDFSETILQEASARSFMEFMRSNGSEVASAAFPRDSELASALDELRARAPDAYEVVDGVFRTGLAAMMLQWPYVTREFEAMMAELAAEPRQKVLRAAQHVQRHRRNGRDSELVAPI